MRIVLVTGKGGVGKTTVAAATALAASDAGSRVLVTSTDPAHSLADALEVGLGSDPTSVTDRLQGQQIDTRTQLDRYWGSIRRQLIEVLDWGGAAGTAFWIDPREKLAAVFMMQAPGQRIFYRFAFRSLVYQSLDA